MEAYSDFAYVYDIFMDNTPYEKWGGFVLDRLRRAGIEDGILLDLGCGTGNMTELLADAGYDMIGVDLSEEMLNVAMEKRACSGHEILYLAQDMREFELYGTVRAVVCFCDSLNYLLEEEELAQCFRLVNEYDLTVFVEEDQKEGLYRRFTETHYQRGYRLDQIRRLLEESGLVFVEALDADTMQEVTEKSERVFCIASEHGKCGTGETK